MTDHRFKSVRIIRREFVRQPMLDVWTSPWTVEYQRVAIGHPSWRSNYSSSRFLVVGRREQKFLFEVEELSLGI